MKCIGSPKCTWNCTGKGNGNGAIGKYGIRGLSGAVFREMMEKTGAYGFEAGKIYNLEASRFIAKGGGLSGAHSDIDGPEVAHAIWQAALV